MCKINMKNILVWGTGKMSRKFAEEIFETKEIRVIGFIDNDVLKQGQIFLGVEVFNPDYIKRTSFDEIVICTIHFGEIEKQILKSYPFAIDRIRNGQYYIFKKELVSRYKHSKDTEIKEIINYLCKRDLQVFNYNFVDKYKNLNVTPLYDEKQEMYYITVNDKKMYFASSLNTSQKVIEYYKSIRIEQDVNSPHRYLLEDFDVNRGDIVVDVGAAEGYFTLGIIDRAKKVYIIEADVEWMKALKQTFCDYKGKVVFINKFITNYTYEKKDKLENLIYEPVNFIKMDIEGSECDAIDGIKEIARISPKLKTVICSYHNDYDEAIIKMKLESINFKSTTSKGYMWYPYKEKNSTKLCRGLVRGIKNIEKEKNFNDDNGKK